MTDRTAPADPREAREWQHRASTFPCCGGRRWVVDENSSDPERRERTRGDGLIPCGTCNFAGWETPENEPAVPWCIECEQPWPCDAETMRLERDAALAARQDEPSPALRDVIATYVIAYPWPAGSGAEQHRQEAIAALDALAANPPQTREARHTIGCECPCHLRTGVPCRDCLGQTREAEGARTPPPCANCHHAYGEHDGWHMLGVARKDWTPRWGGACGFSVDFHHTCSCSQYAIPEAQRDAPPVRMGRIEKRPRLDLTGYGEPAGQRDAGNRGPAIDDFLSCRKCGHYQRTHEARGCLACGCRKFRAAATQPPAAGTEGGE